MLPRWPFPMLHSQCAVCHGWGRARVCAACMERFATTRPRCQRCAIDLPREGLTCGACLRHPPPFSQALAAIDYVYPWAGLITRFKFAEALELGPVFATLLLGAWRRAGAAHPGLLLPVPLADGRWRERGYNQAWELARRCAQGSAAPCDATLLMRVKETPHQLALAPAKRAANVRGAFAVDPLRASELRGRAVTLVDDVMTTGATLREAAEVLKGAGAGPVNVWVLARTPEPGAAEG